MSYCRWSSNDYQCDVYVFASNDGWITYVAGNRVVFAGPLPDSVPFEKGRIDEWLERHEKVCEMADAAEHIDIGLPSACKSFTDPTPGECADRLEGLRAEGFVVPQYAIDALREEEAGG